MNPYLATTRRYFFRECGVGLGKIALASLLVEGGAVVVRSPRPGRRTIAAKAKRVIFLFMAGGAEPARPLRQQADARQARRPAGAS